MKKIFLVALLVFVSSLSWSQSPAPISITSAENQETTISKTQASLIYTLRMRHWESGAMITVFHLPESSPIHMRFVRNVLDMRPEDYSRMVDTKINAGYSSKYREVESQQQMMIKVSITPYSVGYIDEETMLLRGKHDAVKILRIVD
jgi:ABC-type phosphate transport system substrate-binding protein